MKLRDLTIDNKEYEQLLKQYKTKVSTIKGIIDKNDFIKEEILRIKNVYIKPMMTQIGGDFRVVSSFDFTRYVEYGYDWLSAGNDYEIDIIVKNARQSTNHSIHDEALFEKSIIVGLRRGVAFVLYEQFLKYELGLTVESKFMKEVMITYSWDSAAHQGKVVSLTDHLRQKGFHADVDVKLSQEESAIDFIKMMHKSIKEYKKIIIVLSKGYKEKAEVFEKGVGTEYRLILGDIDKNPTKYILVSLEAVHYSIIPFGMVGREIVDMTKQGSNEKLYRKLMDTPQYNFSKVGDQKPELKPKEIEPFTPIPEAAIAINDIVTSRALGSTRYNLIRELIIPCRIAITNTGAKPITDAHIDVVIPKYILDDEMEYISTNDSIIIKFEVKKLFAGQVFQSPEFHLKIRNTNVGIINRPLTIKVFHDYGTEEKSVLIRDFVTYESSYMETNPKPLTEEMFLPPHEM